MYTHSPKKQKSLFRNITDYLKSKGVYDSSKYVKLANQIDWDTLCTPLEKAYCLNNGRPGIEVRVMLALEMLKHMMKGISDQVLVNKLQSDLEIQYFCGFVSTEQKTQMDPSLLSQFRTRLSKFPEILQEIQNVHLIETIKKIPKKRQGEYDQDSTVIHESIKYPHDIDLLNDLIQKGAKLLNICKKAGWKQFQDLVAGGKRLANKLYLKYNFSSGKGKLDFDKTKKQLLNFAKKMETTLEEGFSKFRHISRDTSKEFSQTKNKIKEFITLSKEVISQQSELMKKKAKGVKQSVKNRIISLSKTHVRPIVKGKKGVKVQFGGKAHIGQIGGKIAVFAGLSRENKHDSEYIQDGVEIVEKAIGKPPDELGYDKGGRSQEVYERLEKKGIKNRIQGSPDWNKLTKKERKRCYDRRAFNEAVINDVKNNRGVNNNKYSKNNTEWSIMMGCMASNYIRVR